MADQIQVNRRTILAGAALAGALGPVLSATSAWGQGTMRKASAEEIAALPRQKVELVDPPFVHAHTQVAEGGPKVVQFTMVIEEKKIVIDDAGTEVHAMTFNGTVPGPLMVVHQDDYLELTLINPETNTLLHNIDFHAATGALGGGGLTEINPGEKTVLRFKATKPGVFVYPAHLPEWFRGTWYRA